MASPEQRPPTLFVVDDDSLITASLRGLFALETDYDVHVFTDPQEAAKEAEKRPIDLIISDFLMPRMNGVELLRRIRELQPDAVRILLTGFADKENAIRAINEVGLYQYLEKPWDNDDLLLLIRNALSERTLRKQLSDKVRELDKLIHRHTQLADRHQSLEEELERAAKIQRGLLPAALPVCGVFDAATLFRPCRALGGDFYDVHQSRGTLHYLLADVSGHGAHSALSSMLIKAVFDEAAKDALEDKDGDPAEILAGMNGRLHRFLPDELYACAAVARLDIANGSLVAANAGLPHPLLLRDGGKLEEVAISGMPLGMFERLDVTAFDVREIPLEAGDLLLLLTDGIGDVRNADGEAFEDRALRETLVAQSGKKAAEALAELFQAADKFRATEYYPDDITMLALRRL